MNSIEESKIAETSDTLQEELIIIAKEVISNLYGESAEKIFDYLLKNEHIAEERIINSIDVRSNEARKILQRLSDEAVVTPGKIRDGPDILHIWRLNKPALKTFVLNRLRKTREKLEFVLRHEVEGRIYECNTCHRRFLIEEAYTHGFQCPFDRDLLIEINNPTTMNMIEDYLKKINYLISKIERL
ncbi:MAG: transcription factor TFIIE [Desulfurococcaceae archaeon]